MQGSNDANFSQEYVSSTGYKLLGRISLVSRESGAAAMITCNEMQWANCEDGIWRVWQGSVGALEVLEKMYRLPISTLCVLLAFRLCAQ